MAAIKKHWKATLVTLILLALWYAASESGIWSAYLLPSPQKVWSTFLVMVKNGSMWTHIRVSLVRVFTGFFIAFVLALLLGTIASIFPKATAFYNHIVEFMRNVPPLSLIPLLILWFGIGEKSKIIIIVLASFFPMFLNIKKGLSTCDPKLLEVGTSLHLTEWQKFFRIRAPYALPDILVGMRIGLGYSWRAIIGAEMIAAASGLGYLILDAQQMSRSDKVIVGLFVIGILGSLCNWLFSLCINRFVRGGAPDDIG